MVSALREKGRVSDARELASTVVARGAHNEQFLQELVEMLRDLDGAENWHSVIAELARLDFDAPTDEAVKEYEKHRRYTQGNVLFHRAGWNEGLVEEFRPDTREIVIRFISGRLQEIPITAAVESMVPLDPGDLRAMRILDQEELERLAKEDPSALIRKAAQVSRGRITSTKLKEALSPSIIQKSKWAAYWKRAKAAAAHDPWLQVEGSTARPIFVLRKKPLSLDEEARRAINHADDLAEAISVSREYLDRSHDETARATILEVAKNHVEAAISAAGTDKAVDPADVLDGILLLTEHGLETSISPAEELRVLLYPEEGKFDPSALGRLASQQSRDLAVSLLPQALGDHWAETCVAQLTEFPGSVAEQVVDKLQECNQAHHLLSLWGRVAPYPRRHPVMTYLMGRLYADGIFEGQPGAPDKFTVGRVMLHLCRTLSADRRGSQQKTRLLTRLVSLMVGRRALLATVLDDIDRDTLASYLGITERGGSDFPQEISAAILRAVARKFPDITATEDKPFWQLDNIYVTREGLNRYQEEYRLLVEEKIPANSKAIGVAASHGDLSENSEWDAAMEEQRNLTARASTMDEDLRKARLIEDQSIPEGLVAPGTRVTITDLSDDSSQTFKLLGPWDTFEEGVMNYRAPLGQALLGKQEGEEASIETGDGVRNVRVDSIEKLV